VARAFASVSSQAALEAHVWLGAHGGDVLPCDGVARHLGGSSPAARGDSTSSAAGESN